MIISISGRIGSGKDTVGKIIQYLTTPKGSNEFTLDNYLNDKSSYLYKGNNWEIKKFADKLKDITCILLGCTRDQLEDREFKESTLGEEWEVLVGIKTGILRTKPYFTKEVAENPEKFGFKSVELTPRRILQLLGTDCGRNIIHPNIWVNSLMSEYDKNIGCDNQHCLGLCSVGIDRSGCPLDHAMEYCQAINNKNNWIITDTRFPNELKAVKDREGISIRINRKEYDNSNQIEWTSNKAHKKLLQTFKEEELYKGENYKEPIQDLFNQYYDEFWDKYKIHPSETALDNSKFDYIIENNGSIEELVNKVKVILIKENLIE